MSTSHRESGEVSPGPMLQPWTLSLKQGSLAGPPVGQHLRSCLRSKATPARLVSRILVLDLAQGAREQTFSNEAAFALSTKSNSPSVPQSRNYPSLNLGLNCSCSRIRSCPPGAARPGIPGGFPLATFSGLLGERKPANSDILNTQEWELWVR